MRYRFFRHIILLILAVFGRYQLQAQTTDQNYPVTAQAFIAAQPNARLSTYFSSNTALMVNLLLKDLTKSSIQVYLKWSLDGPGVRVASPDGYIPAGLITLDRGVIARFSGAQLQNDYFLAGAIEEQGLNGNPLRTSLPEGFYTFRVQALEAGTGREVSNIGETYFSITTTLPPIINIPFNGAELTMTQPQRVDIQWMPRHYRLPGNITSYDLKVCKVPDGYEPTEALDACVTPVIDDKGNPGTFYPGNTGIGNSIIGALERGARYAARVTVHEFDVDGNEVVFANDGQSEVTWFRYGKPCSSPETFTINESGPGRVQLGWGAQPDVDGYNVLYRKEGELKWTSQKVSAASATVTGLEGVKYEFAIQSVSSSGGCPVGEPENSQPYTVSSDDQDELDLPVALSDPMNLPVQASGCQSIAPGQPGDYYSNFPGEVAMDTTGKLKIPSCALLSGVFTVCSPEHPSIILPAGQKLTSLTAGDVLGIYDFAVFVTEVSGSGSFSGRGLVRLPFVEGSLALAEFSGVKAIRSGDGAGGCVYEAAEFKILSVSQAEVAAARSKLTGALAKRTDPAAYTGTLADALERYDAVPASAGAEARCSYQAAIVGATQQIKEALQQVLVDNPSPAVSNLIAKVDSLIGSLAGSEKVDNLPQKYRELITQIDAWKQENQQPGGEGGGADPVYQIRNVIVDNITYQGAGISWEGPVGISKYVIEYTDKDGAVLQETVQGTQINLARLREGMQYNYKIIAYKGDEIVADAAGSFATPLRSVPAPENLSYTSLGDGEVKVTWDKNAAHTTFRIEFIDEKGIQRFMYPTSNEAVLKGLDPTHDYHYSVVAYNRENLASNASSGDIMLVDCTVRIHPSARTITQGQRVDLSVTGCAEGTLMWSTGQKDVPQITLTPEKAGPNRYYVTCERAAGSQKKTCSDYVEIIVQPALCADFKISPSKVHVEEAEQVGVIATGCTGSLAWGMGLGTSSTITVAPHQTTEFSATCTLPDGQVCQASTKIAVKCNLDLSVSAYTDWKWWPFAKDTKVVTVKAYCNYDNLTMNGIRLPRTNGDYSITVEGGKDNTFTATCRTPDESCTEELVVKELTKKCDDFKINSRIDGANLILGTSGCSKGNTVQWDNSAEGKQFTVPIPAGITTFKAKCGRNGCETYFTYRPANSSPFNVKFFDESPRSLESSNCSGEIVWSSEPSTGFKSDGRVLQIVPEPQKTTVYTATCKTADNQIFQGNYTFQVLAPCGYILGPETIRLGEAVDLQVVGCTGTASWIAGLTLVGTGQMLHHVPATTTTYSVKCDNTDCSLARTINVSFSMFKIAAAKTFAKIAEPVALTSSGCSGGTVRWSTGETGEGITVRPLNESIYTASCLIDGISVSDKQVTISVDNAPPEDIACPDFNLAVPEGLFPRNANVTVKPVGCPVGSTIIWGDGTVSGPADNLTVQLATDMQVTATCTTPYDMKVKASVSLAVSETFLSVAPLSVVNNAPTVLTASGCYFDETYQWKSKAMLKPGTQITVQQQKETVYTVSCIGPSGQVTKQKDFTIGVSGSSVNCDDFGISEFNGVKAATINSSYYLVAPGESIKMKFICDRCSASLDWSVNGQRIVGGVNGTTGGQSMTYETIAPSSPGQLSFRVNVNGCEKLFTVAVFDCETYRANITFKSGSTAVISSSYCPAYASAFQGSDTYPTVNLTTSAGQPNDFQANVPYGTYRVVCKVKDLANQERSYTVPNLNFSQSDFVNQKPFSRNGYCNASTGPVSEGCVLDVTPVKKNNGWVELRVNNASQCSTEITWENNAGAAGSGTILTVKEPDLDQADYYTASCNDERCTGGTWVNGPYSPTADNPCKGLDRDFSRTYNRDETVILQMSNCPGMVTWYRDPLHKDLICTLTKTGKTTFPVGKLNTTTLFYYNCQLNDGTICESVGTAKIKDSGGNREAVSGLTTTDGQQAQTQSSASGATMRTASTVIEEVCSKSVSLATAMEQFYSKLFCEAANIYTGNRSAAESWLNMLVTSQKQSTFGGMLKFPTDMSGILDQMEDGKCSEAASLLASTNGNTTVTTSYYNSEISPSFATSQDQTTGKLIYQTDGHYSTVYLIGLMLGLPQAKEIAFWTEYPDYVIHDKTAEVRTTWLDADHQKMTHALTNGYHSLEEFLTAVAIINSKATDLQELGRLIHRYGDTFAHTVLKDRVYDPVPINQRRMYGDEVPFTHWTDEHAFADSEKGSGSEPDLIKNDPKWYLHYVKNISELLAMKYGKEPNKVNMAIFEKMSTYANTNGVSLIGIINYEIAKFKGDKSFTIPYPVVEEGASAIDYFISGAVTHFIEAPEYENYIKNTISYLNAQNVLHEIKRANEVIFIGNYPKLSSKEAMFFIK